MAHRVTAAPPIVVWGTGPNSSKSHVCLALLRLLARRGEPVAPFKAVTVVEPARWRRDPGGCPIPHHVAAARTVWRPQMSPVVVEAHDGIGAQRGLLRVLGEPYGEVPLLTTDTMDGADLPQRTRRAVLDVVSASLAGLRGSGARLVIEGAGSPIDARDDLANLPAVREIADAVIVLSAYCWDGGSAAALIGTFSCLPAEIQRSVIGFVQNRPRSEPAARHWAALVTARTGLGLLGTVGDLSHVGSADLLDTCDEFADPWADALAGQADLLLEGRAR
ncbi:hypothetical protein J5X84_14805 [Streptosporangiaceae bacterium NEAU-GS5]|nr:hypothetical protein [Streptosporangiaceae bacterium NEAU-GS5]